MWILTVVGSLTGVAVVVIAGDAFREWLMKGRRGWVAARSGRVFAVWLRFGVPGWGLVSPLLVAPPMATAIGLLLGAPRRRLLTWMSAGVVLWVTVLVGAGMLGLHLIQGAR